LSIEDRELVAEVEGAKVTATSGQPWRILRWSVDSESALVQMLVTEVKNGLSVAHISNATIYSGAVRQAVVREWPKRKSSVTPYCFRHAIAIDMKVAGKEDGDILKALGHCTDVAKSYYWQLGSKFNGVAPFKVEAARPIRRTQPERATKYDLKNVDSDQTISGEIICSKLDLDC
jgi:hypothetical protein